MISHSRLRAVAVVALVVGSLHPHDAQSQSRPRLTREGLKAYQPAKDAVDEFRLNPDCSASTASKVVADLLNLQVAVSQASQMAGIFGQQPMEMLEWHTSLAFEFAGLAQKNGCLDLADQQYRGLIENYVGEAYAGIRDRAKIGVDDIRELRRNAPTVK